MATDPLHIVVGTKRKVVTILIVAVTVATATIGVISYGGFLASPLSAEKGIHIGFSVAPAPLYSKTASQTPEEVNVHGMTQLQFLAAGIDLYITPAPAVGEGFTHTNGSAPLLQLSTNSTGIATGVVPAYAMHNAADWTAYYDSQNESGGNTSFILQLTYSFLYNSTEVIVVPYSSSVLFSPSRIGLNSVIEVNQHPDLNAQPYSFVQLNATATEMAGTASPERIPGCNPYDSWIAYWDQINQTAFSNTVIPLAWGNDANGSQPMEVSLTIGSSSQNIAFQAGNGYDYSGTNSFYIETTGSGNPGGDISGNPAMTLYPSSNSQYGTTATSGYLYAVGNVVVTGYREKEVNTCNHDWYWTNNYESIPEITSLNSNGAGGIQMGAKIFGSSDNSQDVYSSPQALSALQWTKGIVSVKSYTLPAEGEVQYSTIYSDLVSSYSNIVGEINGIIGLGLALLGVIVAADGADWGAIPADVLAITGFVSAVVGELASGMVSASSSVIIYTGFYQNAAGPGGTSLPIAMYSVNTEIGFNGNQYTFPIMDAVAT